MTLAESLYDRAVASLRTCVHDAGLKASGQRAGHHQVWARDAMIAALGGWQTGDAQIQGALLKSLHTLRSKQARSGLIPNNVDAATGRPNYRAYADGGLWWIIGSSFVDPDPETMRRILAWYECQEVDQSGLLSMQEGADWQDLFCTRGKGLYLNALYVLALEAAARTCDEPVFRERAANVRARINEYFWYRGDGNMLRHIRHTFSTESVEEQDSLGRKRWLPRKHALADEPYYLPYLGFRAAGEWFDSLGHVLAIIADVPNRAQTDAILSFILRHKVSDPPMRSLHPQINPGDPDWRDYYGMLNLPGQYHNGGVWPFLGGFWVAALVKVGLFDDAAAALEKLTELNIDGGFNEWHHGITAEPHGVKDQAWSSGMFLYALHCVKERSVMFLTS